MVLDCELQEQIYCTYNKADNKFLILKYRSNTFNLWSIIVSGIDSLNVANHVITIIKPASQLMNT